MKKGDKLLVFDPGCGMLALAQPSDMEQYLSGLSQRLAGALKPKGKK